MKVGVIGLGYVGLPLALLAEEKGFEVTGIEVDKDKLSKLKNRIPIIDDEDANKRLRKTEINLSDDFANLSKADIVVVCVPTPVDKKKMPDLSIVSSAVRSSVKHMKPGSLLVIESTINPGVCDEIVIPLIEKETDYKVGRDIFVAHCPERINPGDHKWTVANINRVLGADSSHGLEIAYEFYSKLIDAKVKRMDSLKEAEAVKIVENSFRDINIAFVNELAMSFRKLGINVNNVIDGAATKPFAFMAHYPGVGVGGHCIPVDPYYLIEYARGNGFEHKFLSLARTINESMPVYSVDLLEQEYILKKGKNLKGTNVAVLGLSYKANVGDDRESPAYTVIKALKARGANVTIYDPFIQKGSGVDTLRQAVENQQILIVATAHKDFEELINLQLTGVEALLDGRNMFTSQYGTFTDKGILYIGIGTK